MEEMALDPQKIYQMPQHLFAQKIDDYILVISRDTANWLLLKGTRQLDIFYFLAEKNTICDTFQKFEEYPQDICSVLRELEAKKFECTTVQYPQEHGMYIYLTNFCNQRCNHCYMYAGESLEKELSTEEIQQILKNFSDHGGTVVTFTGGEPTTRPDFVQIVAYAKKLGLMVGVLSNGLLWSQSFLDSVKNIIDEVQISIDGFDPASYQAVRNMDAFDLALAAVDRLVNAGIRVTVAVSPLLETLLENEDRYIEFAKKLLSKYEGRNFFVRFNTELMEGRTINPSKEENRRYKAAMNGIKSACEPFSEEDGFALDHRHNTVFNNCGYGGFTIASNGDVYFCNLVSKCAKQGNVREDSFEQLLQKAEMARQLSDVNNLSPCRECELKYLCGGGCRVKNFNKLVQVRLPQDGPAVFTREVPCTQEYKEKIYRLMVRANDRFYQHLS